jgi:hypothetical protein
MSQQLCVRMFATTVVGGAFGSAAKIAGSLEGVIRGLSGTDMLHETEGGSQGRQKVNNIQHGLQKGGQVCVNINKNFPENIMYSYSAVTAATAIRTAAAAYAAVMHMLSLLVLTYCCRSPISIELLVCFHATKKQHCCHCRDQRLTALSF